MTDSRTDREILEGIDRAVRDVALKGAKTIEEIEAIVRLLDVSIESLHLTQRTNDALTTAGIKTVRELVRLRASELLELPNVGRMSRNEVVSALAEFGLRLRYDHYFQTTRGVN